MTGLLFDIGGTNTRLAITRDGKRFRTPMIVPTPQQFERGIRSIARLAKKLTGSARITHCAGGVAGTLGKKMDRMINSPHIPGWVRKPVGQRLSRELHAPVLLENDSALNALGEATHGAGRGFKIVAYLTVSTGVGGARVVDGRIDHKTFGFEPGHQIIDPDGPRYPPYRAMNLRGTLEAFISGTAVQLRYRKSPRELSNTGFWRRMAQTLAVGLVNVTVLWSPEVIVLGGSMITKRPGIRVLDVSAKLSVLLRGFLHPPMIKQAQLGDLGGLYGALELLRQPKKNAG